MYYPLPGAATHALLPGHPPWRVPIRTAFVGELELVYLAILVVREQTSDRMTSLGRFVLHIVRQVRPADRLDPGRTARVVPPEDRPPGSVARRESRFADW